MQISKRLLPVALLLLLLVLGSIPAANRYAEKPVFSPIKKNREISILMYHKINPHNSTGGLGLRVLPAQFAWQVKYLREQGFNTISFTDLAEHWENNLPLPPRPVIITFDDGYEDNYYYAYPILKDNGFKATVFLVSNLIGKTNAWDTRFNNQPANKLLTWDQVREMEKNGIEFGAHTATHPILTSIPEDQLVAEVALCKQALEQELGHPIYSFAYPYGKYNTQIKEAVAQAGFKAAVTTSAGKNILQPGDRYALKRLRITGHTNKDRFIRMIEN